MIEFLSGPVLMIIGTCDASGTPGIARGVGVRVEAEAADTIRVFFSDSHWPHIAAHLGGGGLAAATFSRPADYMTYQMKGRASVIDCDEADYAAISEYSHRVEEALSLPSIDPAKVAIWMDIANPRTLRLEVAEVFVQTPGPRAGVRL